jgi:hypothetical protein
LKGNVAGDIKMKAQNQKNNLLTRVGVVGLLAAGVMLLAACQPAAQPTVQAAQAQSFGGGNGQRGNFQMQPAPELPTTQPAARGFLVSRAGDNLVIQMGNPNFQGGGQGQNNGPRPTPNGTPRPRPTFTGQGTVVTVTVTSDTVVYQDVTFASLNGQRPSGSIQQKVEKSSLDALTGNERVTIWGDQNGDQITAKVIVFTQFQGGGQPQQQPQQQSQG